MNEHPSLCMICYLIGAVISVVLFSERTCCYFSCVEVSWVQVPPSPSLSPASFALRLQHKFLFPSPNIGNEEKMGSW